jgi:hypothetical protein
MVKSTRRCFTLHRLLVSAASLGRAFDFHRDGDLVSPFI